MRPSTQGTYTVREWRQADKIKQYTFFTLFVNVISWGLLVALDGGEVFINGQGHTTLVMAMAAYPFLACIFFFPVCGLLMLYHCTALWLNRTELKTCADDLYLTQGPIPWGQKVMKVPLSEIKNVHLQDYNSYLNGDTPEIRYRLVISRYHAGDLVLETGIRTIAQAAAAQSWCHEHLFQSQQKFELPVAA